MLYYTNLNVFRNEIEERQLKSAQTEIKQQYIQIYGDSVDKILKR